MKKRILCILFICMTALLIVGCGAEEKDKEINKKKNENKQIEETKELKDPIVEWCQVYNPNGINTVTCVISNPNKIDIEVTYDLVYYKDGQEVARSKDFSNFSVSPEHNDVIWSNKEIPDPAKVDEIKMENINVLEAYYKSINAEIKHTNTKDGYEYFQIKHKKDPLLSTTTFLLYNDINKNNKCDEGELVVTVTSDTLEKEDTIYFEAEGYDYTDYEIYYNAY